MDLAPTSDQQELGASARRFLEKEVTRERLLAWDRSGEGYDAGFWRDVTALGWLGFSLPESAGGGGASLLDIALILEECGRAMAPAAVGSAIVGARALAALGGAAAARDLPAITRGERQATVAWVEADEVDEWAALRTRVEGSRLSGEKWNVRQGATADRVLVAALEAGEPSLWLVPADARGVSRRDLRTFGGDRQSVFAFDAVTLDPGQRLARGAAAAEGLLRARSEAAALALAECVGGFTAVHEMTIAYVKERVQFGQPLGKFQGVQFRCADMNTALSGMRHLVYQAIWRLSEGLPAERELAIARAFAGPAYKWGTREAHQLHGGAGFVIEHPLHRYSERAEASAILFAREDDALAEVAKALLGPL